MTLMTLTPLLKTLFPRRMSKGSPYRSMPPRRQAVEGWLRSHRASMRHAWRRGRGRPP
jgi:hypothetical protein